MIVSFIGDYKINGRKSVDKAKRSARHLYEYFGNARARDITTAWIKKFIEYQQEKGYSNAEINRQTAALKRMFSLAIEEEKIFSKPHILHLPENNVRTGFFEEEAFLAVLRELPVPIKPVAILAYYLGWRRREIIQLTWSQIDLKERTVRLEVGTTKSKEGREAVFPDELYSIILHQRLKTTELERQQGRIIPWVFHREGEPIKDFRTAWGNACRRAGLPGKYFHDFRRTAYRNMTRLGIPEKVMMDIIGHKTRSMADRYNITDLTARKEAARRMSGIVSGIVEEKTERSGER